MWTANFVSEQEPPCCGQGRSKREVEEASLLGEEGVAIVASSEVHHGSLAGGGQEHKEEVGRVSGLGSWAACVFPGGRR